MSTKTLPSESPHKSILLTAYPLSAIVDEVTLSAIFGVSVRTIKRMVERYELPPPIMLASKRSWKIEAVINWIDAAVAKKESDARLRIQRLQLQL